MNGKKFEKDSSIIEVIREMVAAGESEEKIIQTLQELGVEKAKAERLLLLGQADTFALLKGEIAKIVSEYVNKEKPKLVTFMEEEARRAGEETKKKVENQVMDSIQQYERDITGQSTTFQDKINDTVAKLADLSERVRESLNELGKEVKQVQIDVDEFKLKGIGVRNRWISLLLILLGILFIMFDFYLLVSKFNVPLNIDTVIVAVIVALLGITMMFVATII